MSDTGKSFEEITVGDKASFFVVLTPEDHEKFAALSGDTSPVHTDDEYARAQGFIGKIGYAFHLSSLLSQLYGIHLPGGSSICLKQESNFSNPWYPGDTITVDAEVVRKSESTKMIEIKTEMKRQDGAQVFRGVGIVKLNH